METGPAFEGVLAELEAERAAPYYDAAADQRDREAYYAGLSLGADGRANYDALHALLERTHVTQLAYRPHAFLYPVDIQLNGRLRSLYTGEEYDAEELIQRGFEIEARRLGVLEAVDGGGELSALELAEIAERRFPYDAEHTTCQSWFDSETPMVGDLHALFTCEHACNVVRSNRPYFDFPDYLEVVRERCGKYDDSGFEPYEGKGPACRGVLYFLARYRGKFGTRSRVDRAMIDVLRAWHGEHPVSDYERHRNAAIAGRQGNRNPFIDHPEWGERVDLERSLA